MRTIRRIIESTGKEMDIKKAMERIEALLAEAEKKLLRGETKELQHEINSARQIAAGVKMTLEMKGGKML
jgi:hypothetical protein